jgi:hypothetical protein
MPMKGSLLIGWMTCEQETAQATAAAATSLIYCQRIECVRNSLPAVCQVLLGAVVAN